MTTLDTLQIVVDDEVFQAVRVELRKARRKYPWWPEDMVHAAAVASEESGEVVKAVNNHYWKQGDDTPDDIRKEAIQAIAMWVRFLAETPGIVAERSRNRDVEHEIVSSIWDDEAETYARQMGFAGATD